MLWKSLVWSWRGYIGKWRAHLLRKLWILAERWPELKDSSTFRAEYLRPLANVIDVDPRNTSFVRFDRRAPHGFSPVRFADYHRAISELTLHDGVPHDVVIHF